MQVFLMVTKNRPLSRNVDIERVMENKQIIFHSDHKNRPFLWNVDIFGHIGYSELGGHFKTFILRSYGQK